MAAKAVDASRSASTGTIASPLKMRRYQLPGSPVRLAPVECAVRFADPVRAVMVVGNPVRG